MPRLVTSELSESYDVLLREPLCSERVVVKKENFLERYAEKKWHKSSREGRKDVTDEVHSGRLSTSRTDEHFTRVHELLHTDRRMTFVVTFYLTRIGVETIPQPPYSPDLIPADFFLFPRLNRELKGYHLGTLENVQATTTILLNSISVEEFQGPCTA
ncbi:Hypothetical protein CINCED_3A023770 [Cinara cedri]|uniref:Uncharacterized protein n=1 Tax=Cinara cedri TaxID=506608 RepID=A0A5E4M4D0_9HEMI|nr:Hypothetical protein CINCED_3A023770 [Cinara cedri]